MDPLTYVDVSSSNPIATEPLAAMVEVLVQSRTVASGRVKMCHI
jgi:hypothetical protein